MTPSPISLSAASDTPACFKAYDIRGRVPDDLSPELAYRIGRAFAVEIDAFRVVIGHDVRDSSVPLLEALATGLTLAGCEVCNIGLCGTEEVYFATFDGDFDGGIMVTASHNPLGYNGLKLVRRNSRPISGDSGLNAIGWRVNHEVNPMPDNLGAPPPVNLRPDYIQHLLNYVDPANLEGLRIVTDAGNGPAGLVIDALAPHLPCEFIRIRHQPDARFPDGIPNPLLNENRDLTSAMVREHEADFGIAWDGDFDRCFLFDENGEFVEGYYLVGLLAQAMLERHSEERVVHDPRLVWNTRELVKAAGGVPIQSKTGHAFIKERMRQEDAIYGGEMSGHHYFRSFAYCDNGNIPWLLIAEMMGRSKKPLSALVAERRAAFPVSGEINRKVSDPDTVIDQVHDFLADSVIEEDDTDGLSMDFGNWRFNLRKSNTESLLRLNVESRGDETLMQARTRDLLNLIDTIDKMHTGSSAEVRYAS